MTALVEQDPDTDDTGTDGPDASRPVIGRIVQVVAIVAVIAAIVFGALWLTSSGSGAGNLAAQRDEATAAAQQAAITLNTLDFRAAESGMDAWMATSTGQVLEEFRNNRDDYVKVVTDSRRVTTAQVTDAAATEVDSRVGTARVMVGVDVTVTPEGQEPVITRQRLQLEMVSTPEGWKVGKLAPIRNPGAVAG